MLGADNAQAKHDFASWMGRAGIFASGAGLLELRAAVVIASTDPAASQRGRRRARRAAAQGGRSDLPRSRSPAPKPPSASALTGLPLVLDIAAGRDADGQTKFVLGLGEASVTSALNPPSTLSGAPARHAPPPASLGEGIQPSLIVDLPTFAEPARRDRAAPNSHRSPSSRPTCAAPPRWSAAARSWAAKSSATAWSSGCAERLRPGSALQPAARWPQPARRRRPRGRRRCGRRSRGRCRSARASFRRRLRSSSGRAPSCGRGSRTAVDHRLAVVAARAGAADRIEHQRHRLIPIERARRRLRARTSLR